jgi:Xaa-Pro aminopeptidase
MNQQKLVARLLTWFAENARDLPWRKTRDPYAIWVSEIMLQQTQVKTVVPYWERWLRSLPDIRALADAKPEKLHKLWEGLGYYTRVRNLHAAARLIVDPFVTVTVAEYDNQFGNIQGQVFETNRGGAKRFTIAGGNILGAMDAFPDAEWVDALFVLERQRAKKSPEELKLLKYASEAVIDSMKSVISASKPDVTKNEVVEALRREETNRGLTFEYCLITCGTSLNRAPSDQRWEKGDIMSIDSGGNNHGYIGDVCRMAIQGEPDAELEDLLAEIESIQRAAMRPMRAGALGKEIYAAGELLRAKSKHHNHLDFLAHGMGMVSHEGPRLTDHGPVPYPAEYADQPLESGMVVSVETTLLHPVRGFIKLEDTVVVSDTGHEVYGEGARGWNRAGTR